MISGQAAQPKSSQLLPLAKVIEADDTLREFTQVLRFDIVYDEDRLRAQVLWDRRHKENKSLSKPLGYFPMSGTEQLLRLASNAFTIAGVLAFFRHKKGLPTHEEVESAVNSVLRLVKEDIIISTEVILRDIHLHKLAVEKMKALCLFGEK